MKEKIRFTKEYWAELGGETAGWFIGGALGGLSLDLLGAAELGTAGVWKAAAAMGLLGVLKGLAAKFVGDPQTTAFKRD